jgi:2'-5' RNA ligase
MDRVGGRSAIVVPFALPQPLEAIRRDHVDNARLGVPAHVTLLFPFVPATSLDQGTIDRAGAVIAASEVFDVEFADVTSFDPIPTKEGVVWLAPEPAMPFIALTEALAEAFPGYLPYGGIHETVIPHLTLANVDIDLPALISVAQAELPFQRRVDAAAVLVEDDAGRWRIAERLPLG